MGLQEKTPDLFKPLQIHGLGVEQLESFNLICCFVKTLTNWMFKAVGTTQHIEARMGLKGFSNVSINHLAYLTMYLRLKKKTDSSFKEKVF